MAKLYFPQLASGALAQYPIKKTRLVRTIKNQLLDGSMILFSDPGGAHLIWQMVYTELAIPDIDALQTHFAVCNGPYHAFTFIDPTDNMLVSSLDLTTSPWQTSSSVQISPGLQDPNGRNSAFTVTNTGQAAQEISQKLAVPAGYQYCFSLYAMSAESTLLTVIRKGSSQQQSISALVSPTWTRIVSSGRLSDPGTEFTVSLSLAPGQQIGLYAPQLEPQIAPSRYRATAETGGVYANAHWGVDELTVSAIAPNLFSTSFTIETAT